MATTGLLRKSCPPQLLWLDVDGCQYPQRTPCIRAAAISAGGVLGGPVNAMFPGMTTAIPIADARQIAAGKSNSLPVSLNTAQTQQVRALKPQQTQAFKQPGLAPRPNRCSDRAPTARRYRQVIAGASSSVFPPTIPTPLASDTKRWMRTATPSRARLKTSGRLTQHTSMSACRLPPTTKRPLKPGSS